MHDVECCRVYVCCGVRKMHANTDLMYTFNIWKILRPGRILAACKKEQTSQSLEPRPSSGISNILVVLSSFVFYFLCIQKFSNFRNFWCTSLVRKITIAVCEDYEPLFAGRRVFLNLCMP